jgi:hypothetical protein
MLQKSDMNSDSLFSMWARLGANFPAFKPSREESLVEELIAQTSLIGRYEPRLIEGMVGWLKKHGDLINTSLIRRHIECGDSAVIGLVFDTLTSKETAKLKQLHRQSNCAGSQLHPFGELPDVRYSSGSPNQATLASALVAYLIAEGYMDIFKHGRECFVGKP